MNLQNLWGQNIISHHTNFTFGLTGQANAWAFFGLTTHNVDELETLSIIFRLIYISVLSKILSCMFFYHASFLKFMGFY